MQRFFLVLILAAFIVATLARQPREDTRVEVPKPIKIQSGVITIKEAKPRAHGTGERHHPRGARKLRKTVVKITQTSPAVTPTTATKSQLVALPFQNEISPTTPASNTGATGGLSYQYNPGSFVLGHGFVDYDHKQQKYTHRQQRAPATFQPSTPLIYSDYDTGLYFQPYIQTAAYMTPPVPDMYTYAPGYIPATTTAPKNTVRSTITKARTVPVAIYYAEEAEPVKEEPTTTAAPIRFSYPKKKLRVKKVPVRQTVSSPPTVTFHSYKIPLSTPYSAAQEQQQLQQPYVQTVYSTTPQFSFYSQPLAEPPTVSSTPYYPNTATVYGSPLQQYAGFAVSAGGGAAGKVAGTKVRPTGLGISYSPVGPGIASYNFQGFGVEYGY